MKLRIFLIILIACFFLNDCSVHEKEERPKMYGLEIEKIEIYKHEEIEGMEKFDIDRLNKGNLIKTLTRVEKLRIFRKAVIEDSEIVDNTNIQFKMISPEYDVVVYFLDGTYVRNFLWSGFSTFSNGSKLYILKNESIKKLKEIIGIGEEQAYCQEQRDASLGFICYIPITHHSEYSASKLEA